MDKRSVIRMIQSHLEEELSERRAADSISKSPSPELQELERAALMYRFLPLRDFTEEDVVAPASLVELELSGRRLWVLVVPNHGGLVTSYEGCPVQVVTPHSPLGEAMLGKKSGDSFRLETSSGARLYRIVRVL